MPITYTALIWTGIILALFGAITAVLGLGGTTVFEASLGNINVKTNQTGLAILAVGAALAGTVALKLPERVRVSEEGEKYSFTEKLVKKTPMAVLSLMIGAVAIILFVLTFL